MCLNKLEYLSYYDWKLDDHVNDMLMCYVRKIDLILIIFWSNSRFREILRRSILYIQLRNKIIYITFLNIRLIKNKILLEFRKLLLSVNIESQ